MGELEKPGNSLTFKKTEGVSVDVPIVEAGAAEISAHLEVAREMGSASGRARTVNTI